MIKRTKEKETCNMHDVVTPLSTQRTVKKEKEKEKRKVSPTYEKGNNAKKSKDIFTKIKRKNK